MPRQSDVSVIIPVFNGAAHIQKCLDSLLIQETEPLEIIVVDNGSTDETLSIASRYGKVRLIEEETPGASKARNKGAKEAKGSILAFIDADCQAEPDWIKEAWHIMQKEKTVDGLVGFSKGINKNLWAFFFQRRYDDFINEIQDGDGRLLKIDTKNCFLKRDVFQEIGGFDPSIGNSEDVDLGIRLHLGGYRIQYAASVGILHMNPTSLSSRLRVCREQAFFDFTIFRKIPSEKGSKYYPAFNRFYSHYIFLKHPSPPRAVFSVLLLIAETGIHVCKSLLIALEYCGLSKRLYPLDHLLMAFGAFQGKLYAREVESGYTELKNLVARGKFSRRLG
jgi:glycosyltransferase involved in cell wall biosynthesis